MSPTDLGLDGAFLLTTVTKMFTTLAPWIIVVLPVLAVVMGVRYGLKKAQAAAGGKTS